MCDCDGPSAGTTPEPEQIKVVDADREYGQALEARYGWKGDELPETLVEVIDYGNAPSFPITLKWLDAEMAKIGLTPLSPNIRGVADGRTSEPKSNP